MSSTLEMRRSKCYCLYLMYFYLFFFSLGNMCHNLIHNMQTNREPDNHRASLLLAILSHIFSIHYIPILYAQTTFTYYYNSLNTLTLNHIYLQIIFTPALNPNYLHIILTFNPSNLQIISTPNPLYLQTIYINCLQTHTELSHLTYIPSYLKPTHSNTYGSQ